MASQQYIIKDTCIVNEGQRTYGDVWIAGGRIEKAGGTIAVAGNVKEVNGKGQFLLPGAVGDQVHFREPGLTHKASIYTEAKAAVGGGVTSFLEMRA